MSGKFQNSEDSKNSKDLYDFTDGQKGLQFVFIVNFEKDQRKVEWQDCYEVNDIEGFAEELDTVRAGPNAQKIFKAEPPYANVLNHLQGRIIL